MNKNLEHWKNKFPGISNSILLFYIGLLGGWGDRLLPPRVMDFLEESRKSQLVLVYILILFSIEIFGDKVTNIGNSFLYAFIILFFFLIISKQSIPFFFVSIILLLITYFVNKQKNLIKDNIHKSTKRTESKLEFAENILILSTIATVGIGFTLYLIKQYKAYGSKSSNIFIFLSKFLLEGSNRIYNSSSNVF